MILVALLVMQGERISMPSIAAADGRDPKQFSADMAPGLRIRRRGQWFNYIPSVCETALHLEGVLADEAIHLNWTTDVTLPQTIAPTIVVADSLTNAARVYVLTSLESYQAYTVTLSLDALQAMSDTACVLLTDIFCILARRAE